MERKDRRQQLPQKERREQISDVLEKFHLKTVELYELLAKAKRTREDAKKVFGCLSSILMAATLLFAFAREADSASKSAANPSEANPHSLVLTPEELQKLTSNPTVAHFLTVWNNYKWHLGLSTDLLITWPNTPYALTGQAPNYPAWTHDEYISQQVIRFVSYPTALVKITDVSKTRVDVWDSRMAASNCGPASPNTGWPLGPFFDVLYNSDIMTKPRVHVQNTSGITLTVVYTDGMGIGQVVGTFGPEDPNSYNDPEIYFPGDWQGQIVASSDTGWCGVAYWDFTQFDPDNVTPTPTATNTPEATFTPTSTPFSTPTQTSTPTRTSTPTPTNTSTPTPTATQTPPPTQTPVSTPEVVPPTPKFAIFFPIVIRP